MASCYRYGIHSYILIGQRKNRHMCIYVCILPCACSGIAPTLAGQAITRLVFSMFNYSCSRVTYVSLCKLKPTIKFFTVSMTFSRISHEVNLLGSCMRIILASQLGKILSAAILVMIHCYCAIAIYSNII